MEEKNIPGRDRSEGIRIFPGSMAALPGAGWKKPLGDDWEDVLSIIVWKWSPETYLTKERKLKPEQDFHYQFKAQAASLSRRMYKEHGAGLQELQVLKSIYLLYIGKEVVVSKTSPEQEQLLEKTGVDLSLC